MKITLIYIILLLYTYGMQYIFLPFSTRVLLGILGFIISVFTVLISRKKIWEYPFNCVNSKISIY
ncbi:hypothetical protein N5T90_11695 [Aliarcobacter cryaerophilus]|uniref:hypothetical protein n=1 Tax=Aliarcobacter cryaerophilus TaxID=28198 RepID=UPI0021B61F3D|nr:hypothetical protein [Aliarcobacter cryaerophilus]MCT7471535.1 hypothetical protein [Aliarcobacter cryaerophilus]